MTDSVSLHVVVQDSERSTKLKRGTGESEPLLVARSCRCCRSLARQSTMTLSRGMSLDDPRRSANGHVLLRLSHLCLACPVLLKVPRSLSTRNRGVRTLLLAAANSQFISYRSGTHRCPHRQGSHCRTHFSPSMTAYFNIGSQLHRASRVNLAHKAANAISRFDRTIHLRPSAACQISPSVMLVIQPLWTTLSLHFVVTVKFWQRT